MRQPVPRNGPAEEVVPFGERKLPAPTMTIGRPTELTDSKARTILAALYAGAYRATAARYAKIPPETLSRWLSLDREPYKTFHEWVNEAEAAFEMRALLSISNKMQDKPELAVTMLERKFPQRWARVVAAPNTNVNVSFSVTAALQQIEKRAERLRDPRPALPNRETIIDVIRAPVRQPVINGHAEQAETTVSTERAVGTESPEHRERRDENVHAA